ncbi:MAG: hypothetical protein JXA73_22415 [Acidobacteria bacterium]|nr:hypothetical protein [Acidobacteriota bacterium]
MDNVIYDTINQKISESAEETPRKDHVPDLLSSMIEQADTASTRLLNVDIADYSSKVSLENRLNEARMRQYRGEFNVKLTELIRESDFEYGRDSSADFFLRERLAENASVTKEWINSLFIDNYGDAAIAAGILRVLAHLRYHEVAPQGPTIALAALAHQSVEVRECGIRAFENWGTVECLNSLKNVSPPEEWLKSYIQQVLADLEESLRNAPIG